jgi:type I restriction enzyme S subunit
MNQTLESMAQAIFKSWFVDFDPVHAKAGTSSEDELDKAAKDLGISREVLDLFPSEFEESEVGLIPRGWEVKRIGDIAIVIDYVANGSFAALKENVNLYDEENEVLYVRTTDFKNNFNNSLKYTDNESYDFLRKSKLYGHETLISNVASIGTVFRAPKWLSLPMTLGSNAIGVTGKDREYLDSYLFYFFRSYKGQALLSGITTGSAQLKFNKTDFRRLSVQLSEISLRQKFEVIEQDIYNQIINNQRQLISLQKTRDTLLPKLLSGELDVSNLDLGLSDD